MSYELTDYQGNKITVTGEQAAKIADVAGLMAVDVNGQEHFLSPSNIASIKPMAGNVATDLSYRRPVLPGGNGKSTELSTGQ
jgi:hypothetical protein